MTTTLRTFSSEPTSAWLSFGQSPGECGRGEVRLVLQSLEWVELQAFDEDPCLAFLLGAPRGPLKGPRAVPK
jgi:hypothetical protein